MANREIKPSEQCEQCDGKGCQSCDYTGIREDITDMLLEESFVYKPSGLICEVCGYNDSLKCYIDLPVEDDEKPYAILCGEHAAKEGYCCCCGLFYECTHDWDMHPGYCDNCYQEVRDNFDDEDDEYYDPEYY